MIEVTIISLIVLGIIWKFCRSSANHQEWLDGTRHAEKLEQEHGIARVKFEADLEKGAFKEGMLAHYWSVVHDTRP